MCSANGCDFPQFPLPRRETSVYNSTEYIYIYIYPAMFGAASARGLAEFAPAMLAAASARGLTVFVRAMYAVPRLFAVEGRRGQGVAAEGEGVGAGPHGVQHRRQDRAVPRVPGR